MIDSNGNINIRVSTDTQQAEQGLIKLKTLANELKAAHEKAYRIDPKSGTAEIRGVTLDVEKLAKAYGQVDNAIKEVNSSLKSNAFTSYSNQLKSVQLQAEQLHQQWITSGKSLDGYRERMRSLETQAVSLRNNMKNMPDLLSGTKGSDSYLGSLEQKLRSHMNWIIAGSMIAGAVAIPTEVINNLRETEALTLKIQQNLELASRYKDNEHGLQSDVKHLQDVAATFAMGYGTSLKDSLEMMQVLSRRFKSPEELTYYTNLAMVLHKLDFVEPKKAAEDLEATILSMGLDFNGAKKFIDEFSVAVHTARITGTELLSGLQRSGATFHNMNLNTAEAIAMISTLSTVTAKAGANIGASLNSVLINIDFKKATEALKAYNIEVYDSNLKMRDGVEIWREIAKVFNGLDDKHANEFANAMSGGKFRANDLRALIGNWQTFEQILNDINTKASPELTNKLLQTGLSSLDTELKRLSASVQVLGIALSKNALPALKSMIVGLTEGVQWLNKNKDTCNEVITVIKYFIEALVIYNLHQRLANGSLGGFVTRMKTTVSESGGFIGSIKNMGLSFLSLAKTIGIAALELAAFQALARIASGKMADSDEKSFLQKVGGVGSRDAGAGRELTQQEKEALEAIHVRDEYTKNNAVSSGENQVTGKWAWFSNGDKQAKFDRLNEIAKQKIAAANGLADVNKMVDEATKRISEMDKKALANYDKVQGVDLSDPKGSGSKTPPTDYSSTFENKLDKYQLNSTLDNAKVSADKFKTVIDSIIDAENRMGKSYELLDQHIAAMDGNLSSLRKTRDDLVTQSVADMQKINDLASQTGATVITTGANTGNTEGSTWNRETGSVNIEGLQKNALSAISAVSQKFYDLTGQQMVVSSGLRNWGGHVSGQKFDVVDSSTNTLLEENKDGIRDAIIEYAQSLGLSVIDEYKNPSTNATGGHLDFDASSFVSGMRQVTIEGLSDVLSANGISQDAWKGFSKDQKLEFTKAHKDQIKHGNELIGYLERESEIEQKIAEYERKIADENRKRYETMLKGISDIENYQNELSDLKKRTLIAQGGVALTDNQKNAIELQALAEHKKHSDEALKQMAARGISTESPDYQKEYVKNLELQNQWQKDLLGSALNPDKQIDRRLKNISTQEDIDKNSINKRDPLWQFEQQKIEMSAEKNRYAQYEAKGRELEKQRQELLDALPALIEKLKKDQEEAKAMEDSADKTARLKQITEALTAAQNKNTAAIQSNSDAQLQNNKDKIDSMNKQKVLAQQTSQEIKTYWADSFLSIANHTSSFKDVMKNVWSQIQKDAVYSILGIEHQATAATKMFGKGKSGGAAKVPTGGKGGKKHATGAVLNAPAFVSNRGDIAGEDGEETIIIPTEKNKQNSKKLLDYASQRVGYTPNISQYTPYFKNTELATNPVVNVQVQQLQEQQAHIRELEQHTKILTGMFNHMLNNQGGNSGGVAIFNSAVSAEQIGEVLKNNPEMMQNLMGRQRNGGWR